MPRKQNAEEIFNKAVEMSDSTEQSAYLDQACGGDEKLRAEVDALLKWNQEAGSFLDLPETDPNVTLSTSANMVRLWGGHWSVQAPGASRCARMDSVWRSLPLMARSISGTSQKSKRCCQT